MNFDPGLEQLRGDQATFESAQELSHIFSYNLRPKKLFLVWVDFPALCLKVAISLYCVFGMRWYCFSVGGMNAPFSCLAQITQTLKPIYRKKSINDINYEVATRCPVLYQEQLVGCI